jgi:acetolactate synthase-1/2/3 large subunit
MAYIVRVAHQAPSDQPGQRALPAVDRALGLPLEVTSIGPSDGMAIAIENGDPAEDGKAPNFNFVVTEGGIETERYDNVSLSDIAATVNKASKRVKVDVPIVGNVREVLQEMIKLVQASREKRDAEALKAWWAQIDLWRERDCLKFDRASKIIKPQFVIEKLWEITKGDAFVTSDVGQHQMWAAQFYKFTKPRRWINSGGLGTMGFGLPSAVGVQMAHPKSPVACVTGEASIQMCIQELSTCKQYHLPIKILCLNNRYMGMVRQWQEFFHGNRYAESYMNALPDFVRLAESYGHIGMRIEKPGDVEGAIKEAFSRKKDLVFLDFVTDQTENVFPMVPGGKGLSEMILV